MTMWEWADKHWIVSAIVLITLASGVAGLLDNWHKRRS